MFQIIFRAQVAPANREKFIEFISEDIRGAEKNEPGTLRFDLFQDENDENAFFIHEGYQDEKAFKDHQQSDLFKRWESDIRPKIVKRFDRSLEGDPLRSLVPKKQMTDPERSFRAKDYEIKAAYLNGQFTRMWQRFQFFVTIQTALVGGKVVFGDRSFIPLAIAGAVISLACFIIGAEDRYLVTAYRLQADAAGKASARWMLGEAEAKAYEPVGQLKPRSPKLTFELKGLNWLERLTEWRCEEISITRLPAWLALLALVGWLSMLIAHFTFKGTHIGRFATVCKQQLCTGSVFKKIRVTSETMSRYSGSDVDLNRSDLSSTSRRTPSELRSGLESYRTTSSLETRDSQCERNDSFEVVHEGGWTHNTLKLREATRSLDRASVGFRHVWTRALTSRLARHLSSVSNERWSMDRIVLALPA